MISKSFTVWTDDDQFEKLNPIEIFCNANGGITLREECDDDVPIEMRSIIIISPDMVDDVIKALRVLKSEMQ
jgi:hypothetical protein